MVQQSEIDSVAHFLQIVEDLRSSPFFADGQTGLGITHSGAGAIYRVPDAIVRDSVIIPFRKLWMENEQDNFLKTLKIVSRHLPERRPILESLRRTFKSQLLEYPPYTKETVGTCELMTPKGTINLWLNCRIAHSGTRGRAGELTYTDFHNEIKGWAPRNSSTFL